MKHLQIYKLWDSIGDMAADLNESAMDLLNRRTNGLLPDVRHDKTILARAIHRNVYVRQSHLDAIRREPKAKELMHERRGAIRDFIANMGGTSLFAERVGTTPNALRVAQHRGKLPASIKFETYNAAQAAGVEFDEALFDGPHGDA